MNFYAVNGNFEQPIDSTSKINLGVKSMIWRSIVKSDNFFEDHDSIKGGETRIDESLSFSYLEYEKQYGNLSFNTGIRVEYSEQFSNNITSDSIIIDRKYWGWYPVLNLTFSLKNEHSAGFYANRKVLRPSYHDLLPSFKYYDTLTIRTGNQKLINESYKNLSAYYQIGALGTFMVEYIHHKNAIIKWNDVLVENNRFLRMPRNINLLQSIGLKYNVNIRPKKIPWFLSSSHRIEGIYNKIEFSHKGNRLENALPHLYYYTSNTFRLFKQLDLELIFRYQSSHINGLAITESNSQFNLVLSKKIFKKRLNVRLVAYDIFRQTIVTSHYQFVDNGSYTKNWNRHRYTYEVSLTFNVMKNKVDKIKNFYKDDNILR